MWNLKKKGYKRNYIQNRPTNKENRLWLPKEKGGWKDKLRVWD